MGDSTPSPEEREIQYLEKINEIIDLCIDSELYDYLRKIIPDSSLDGVACTQFKDLKNKNPRNIETFKVNLADCPIKNVVPLDDFKEYFNREFPGIDPQLSNSKLLKHWSKIFWAKLIRAELKRLNRTPWVKLYDDLNLFLESNIPADIPKKPNQAWKRTLFNYLMELSAVAQGEASIGYAERSRSILKDILGNTKKERIQRNNFGDPYDRWIWYNFGMAYQHIGLHQKAALEFNRVTAKYFKYTESKKNEYNFDLSLEFLLNIVPAILQRADLNLQLQLSYHALQTLDEKKIYTRFRILEKENKFYREVVTRLKIRINLLKLDALLKLGDSPRVEKYFKKLYSFIFANESWDHVKRKLPSCKFNVMNPPSYPHVRLIEHTVEWYLDNTYQLLEDIKDLDINRQDTVDNIDHGIDLLSQRLMSIRKAYWSWVIDNQYDQRIYFSKWAKFLGLSAKIMGESKKNKLIKLKPILSLLSSLIKLYNEHRESLPIQRNERNNYDKTIQLENSRSDDLTDIEKGLNDFYSELLKVRDDIKFVKIIKNNLKTKKNFNDPFDQLRKDHLRVLRAIDEYNEQFGENQRVKALKRYDKWIKWFDIKNNNKTCTKCLNSNSKAFRPRKEEFYDLLKCCESECLPKTSLRRDDKRLESYDYESIMTFAEKGFTKHLEKPSVHASANSLHFIGLQRWNSLTPAQGRSVGGGYFLYHTDERGIVDLGIAIDPGFDFVRNFFRNGFSIRDIDVILISHAHADHLWDFESIVQLLKALNDTKHIKHRINVILTLGIYSKFEHIITNQALRQFIEPFVIDIRKEIDPDFFKKLGPIQGGKTIPESDYMKRCFRFVKEPKENGRREKLQRWKPYLPLHSNPKNISKYGELEIWPTCAYHDDYSEISDSFGFKLNIHLPKEQSILFGYTGDTKWVGDELYNKDYLHHNYKHNLKTCQSNHECIESHWKNVAGQYKDCDVLLIHLGSLIDHKNCLKNKFEYYESAKECDELIREKNHPYLMGMIRFLRELYNDKQKKLILIGEFGEELRGGIRVDIVKRLQAGLTPLWPMLPVDVGLDIELRNNKPSDDNNGYEFICALCDKPRLIGNIIGENFHSKIEYHRYGHDEAIFYICHTCYKSVPEDVRQNKLMQLYEIGRELKTEIDLVNAD